MPEPAVPERKMSDMLVMQYMGFACKETAREYTFQVRYAKEDMREFTLTIMNEAFVSRRVRYQDAPDVCSSKLRRELATDASQPTNTCFPITDLELDNYRLAHTRKAAKGFYQPKPKDDY
jgi:hypothetical protein